MIRLWKYLRGYVIIEVYGFSVERFVNLCMKKGIRLWNIARESNKLVMYVSLHEMEDLESCIKKTGCEVKIRKEVGFPFFLRRYKKRKIFIVGALITCIVLFLLSSVVWEVDIYGNDAYSTSEIEQILREYGLDVGTLKFQVDCKRIESDILLEHPNISWISMEIRGSRLIINLAETVDTPDMIELNKKPVNIIADKDCVIHYIITRAGKAKVKKGDVVTKGEVLVTGALEILNDDQSIRYRYVHANADVFGKVYYSIDDVLKLDYIEKNFTQKKKYEFYAVFGSKELKFFRPFKYFLHSDQVANEHHFSFLNLFSIGIKKVVHHEYIPIKKKYTKEEAKEKLELRANRAIEKSFGEATEIIDKKIVYTIREKDVKSAVKVVVIEKIGVTKEIEERIEEWTEEENP